MPGMGAAPEAGRAHDPVAAFALRRESRATRAARGRVSFAKVIFLSSATPIVPKWEKNWWGSSVGTWIKAFLGKLGYLMFLLAV